MRFGNCITLCIIVTAPRVADLHSFSEYGHSLEIPRSFQCPELYFVNQNWAYPFSYSGTAFKPTNEERVRVADSHKSGLFIVALFGFVFSSSYYYSFVQPFGVAQSSDGSCKACWWKGQGRG